MLCEIIHKKVKLQTFQFATFKSEIFPLNSSGNSETKHLKNSLFIIGLKYTKQIYKQ